MAKNPLQALLFAGEDLRDRVLDNSKQCTIRAGHRSYRLGAVILCCHILNWATMREITEVSMTTLGKLDQQDLEDDGFSSHEEALEKLQTYYPDLTLDSPITFIRWQELPE